MNDLELITSLENKYPVAEWTVNGIHIWPYVRFVIGEAMDAGRREAASPAPHLAVLPKKLRLFMRHVSTYVKLKLFNVTTNAAVAQSDALFYFNGVDRALYGATWVPKQAYALQQELKKRGKTYLNVENVFYGNYRIPRNEPSHIASFPLRRAFYAIKHFFLRPIPSCHLPRFDEFLAESNRLVPGLGLPKHHIEAELRILEEESFYFEKLLKRAAPRVVFVIGYYAFSWALNIACRRLNIISSDLQHGIAGRNFHPYGQWRRVPPDGYEMLPEIFFTWGEDDRRAIEDWSITTSFHRAIQTGNMWLQFFNMSDDPLIVSYRLLIETFLNRHRAKHVVLFTHQIPCGFPDWFVRAINDSSRDIFWIIRLHPCAQNSRHQTLRLFGGLSHVDVDQIAQLPLPLLFQYCDLHVTGWSAAVYEALENNVPSVLIHPRGQKYYQKEILTNICFTAFDEPSLLKILTDNKIFKSSSDSTGTDADFEQIFQLFE